jgi:hypothetical protein
LKRGGLLERGGLLKRKEGNIHIKFKKKKKKTSS